MSNPNSNMSNRAIHQRAAWRVSLDATRRHTGHALQRLGGRCRIATIVNHLVPYIAYSLHAPKTPPPLPLLRNKYHARDESTARALLVAAAAAARLGTNSLR